MAAFIISGLIVSAHNNTTTPGLITEGIMRSDANTHKNLTERNPVLQTIDSPQFWFTFDGDLLD
jgi:hypothetical protein